DSKHLDLNPRLSATVIRSHVKLGVEKAHQLRLPQEVIDIIAEHHG
ncbi:HDIG domain-containing metalloprotein, partial [Treponema pallidum]